ncbi:MAG: PRC-barrel domain-containing protein [Phycisphaerales bacterium]|nr:PRC-barrel domain-containing protein [Phycisphaerales bacterium]
MKMNTMSRLVMIAAVGGLPLALCAQDNSGRQPAAQHDTSRDTKGWNRDSASHAPPNFASALRLDGTDVYNSNDEHVADVSDFVVDRGSGDLRYVVVKTGGILGMGGRAVAIPFESFSWTGKDRAILNATKEQLRAYPEFNAKEWTAMVESGDTGRSSLWQRFKRDTHEDMDTYREAFRSGAEKDIKGEVTGVRRDYTGSGEYVTISVRTDAGETRTIALGPTWYVNPSAAAPMRGDTVSILAYPVPGKDTFVARHARIGQHDLDLRNEQGEPVWTAKAGNANAARRYILLSDLKGMKITCRGEECGKVNDVIVNEPTGQIAFLSIDPNQNFLGMGDTKRLVPFNTATIATDGVVRLDASKEMVLASPETPPDISSLNNSTLYTAVYNAYQVEPYRFRNDARSGGMNGDRVAGAWGSDGHFLSSLDRGNTVTFSGEIVDVDTDTTRFSGDRKVETRTIKIKTPDGNQEILLGPESYFDAQSLTCKKGDRVQVQAARATINGKQYWVATSVDAGGRTTVLVPEDR